MGEGTLEKLFAIVAALLVACGEIVELFEPQPREPEWKFRAYRTALRLTARAVR
ncbi:MAG TPA: hypothetical protein VFM88_04990 [Vicinamibacteria bacterium]|nr:hypothetical protein [Vicinamibacteria bacterium]